MKRIDIIKPFFKWIGGKTQIINKLINYYPTEMNNYHDIFLGGGSTLLAMLSFVNAKKIHVKNKIYAYDLNSNLIDVYKTVQSEPIELYNEIKLLIDEYNSCDDIKINRHPKSIKDAKTSKESFYYWIRSKYNKILNEKRSITKSAMFIFINKTCFRGMYRIGNNGYNVPFGHYINPKIIDKDELLAISKLIKNVKFKHADFEKSLSNIKFGDFIYLDPPYVPEKDTSFVKYTLNGFDIEQHKKLFEICNELYNRNIKFIMSNSNVKLVIDSFPINKYDIVIIECKRAIHYKNPRKKTEEVIIKSF